MTSDREPPASQDQLLRRLLAEDPQVALEQVLASLGGPGLLAPILDASFVELLLREPGLDPTQLRRLVTEAVLARGLSQSTARVAAGRADLDDQTALELLSRRIDPSVYTIPSRTWTDPIWQAFHAARHPVAAAWLLALVDLYDTERPAAAAAAAGRRADADGTAALAGEWLTRLRTAPDPVTVAVTVVRLAETWTGSATDLLATATAVAAGPDA